MPVKMLKLCNGLLKHVLIEDICWYVNTVD